MSFRKTTMLPVTGPHIKESGSREGTSYSKTSSYRQKRPYNLNLNPFYGSKSQYTLSHNLFVFGNPGVITDYMMSECVQAQPSEDNAAYAKFLGKMRAQDASLGVTLAEHQSSRKMIIDRTGQLVKFVKALRGRDFRYAYKVATQDFKGRPPPGTRKPYWEDTHRYRAKDFSSIYLEWSWGWAPAISDISDSLETLVDPVIPIYVRASHKNFYFKTPRHYSNIAGQGGRYPADVYYRDVKEEFWDVWRTVSTGGKIAVDNPNVALANRLGVLNLPKILWSVQPFSFVVDKYINIGQMIGTLTDTYGFTITESWTSRRIDIISYGTWYEYNSLPGSELKRIIRSSGVHSCKRRLPGLLGPSLTLRSPSIGSFGEAVSYCALLIQLLSKD